MRVRARRRVHRNADDRCREVGSVIEIEATEVVLIRLALAAMLAHDQAGHGFEHLAGAHHRPGIQLGGGDGSLAGSRSNADEVGRGILDVRDVSEAAGPGDDDVGAQRQRHDRVGRDRRAARHRDGAPKHAEIEKPESELGAARRNRIESIAADVVGGGCQLLRVDDQVDRDARQHGASLIEDAPADAAGRLGVGVERDAEEND